MHRRLTQRDQHDKLPKIVLIMVFLGLTSLLLASQTRAKVITVGKVTDPSTLGTPKLALKRAQPRDVIEVYSGTYKGNLAIETENIVLRGIGRPVIQGGKTGTAVTVSASSVVVEGFVIRGGGRESLTDDAGLKVMKAKECVVRRNRFEDNFHGVYLNGAEKCSVTNNVIRGRTYDYQEYRGNGIHLHDSPFAKVEHNDIADTRDGVYVSFSGHCTIDYNKIHRLRYGLHYMYSHNNSFAYNTLINNVAGAAVMYARNIKFNGNIVAHNRGARAYGILWQNVRHSECFDNLIFDNTIGLYMDFAGFSKVTTTRLLQTM
jgi:nitrous oxidase accessory protein